LQSEDADVLLGRHVHQYLHSLSHAAKETRVCEHYDCFTNLMSARNLYYPMQQA